VRRLRSSKIKKRVSIPNIVGMVRSEALSLLNGLGLSVIENNTGTSNESLGGKIIDQSITENSVVPVGTQIEYTYGSFSFTPFSFTPFSFTVPVDPPVDPPLYSFNYFDLPFSFAPIVLPPYDFTTYNFTGFSFAPTPGEGGKSLGAASLVKSKNPQGLILAYNLKVGDVLYSASIEGIDTSNDQILNYIQNWSTQDTLINTDIETTVVAMAARITDGAIVINENKYSKAHWILIKNNEGIKFKNVTDVLLTDLIFSPMTQDWNPVTQCMPINSTELVISINVEPYDVFFTDNALVHDSYNAAIDPNAINSSSEDFSEKLIEMYTEWQNLIKK
jgi:hypothetical protein